MQEEITIMEFATFLKDQILESHPEMADDHEIEIHETRKNNSVRLVGLVIRKKDVNVSPTIYLEPSYESFLEGTSIGEIAEDIIKTYEIHKVDSCSVDFINDLSTVRDRLSLKIINTAMNKDLLSEVPHLKYGDLSVIFQIKVHEKPFGNGVITLKNEHIKLWNDDISPYELFELARENIEKQDPITIRSMYEVLSSLVPAPEDTDIKACPMYVATNESKISGAVAILFADKLMEFADKIDSDLLILPSSVQELVIVPSEMNADLSNLLAMVKEINETQVSPEEVLSDNVYIFDRETQMVCDALTGKPCVLTEDMGEAAA